MLPKDFVNSLVMLPLAAVRFESIVPWVIRSGVFAAAGSTWFNNMVLGLWYRTEWYGTVLYQLLCVMANISGRRLDTNFFTIH